MKIRFTNSFLHITAVGTLVLTLFTDSLVYPPYIWVLPWKFNFKLKRNSE